ncbi:hypothetical protein TNCV_1265601 [Trichonephila clavipes]|nr:hypothetical protein TNCV_1265601 [Trichonephila clavipes]
MSPGSAYPMILAVLSHIWKETGIFYLLSNVQEIDRYGSGGLMVWEDITLGGHKHLHVFERGIVAAVTYWDEVLEPYVCLYSSTGRRISLK